jgi:hypothetical protein
MQDMKKWSFHFRFFSWGTAPATFGNVGRPRSAIFDLTAVFMKTLSSFRAPLQSHGKISANWITSRIVQCFLIGGAQLPLFAADLSQSPGSRLLKRHIKNRARNMESVHLCRLSFLAGIFL